MMTGEEQYQDYQYHSADLDLSGDPDAGDWSIRCTDVHKRLGGVPVLNGLTLAIPDDTITVVLGPSGTGKSVLIKHLDRADVPRLGRRRRARRTRAAA